MDRATNTVTKSAGAPHRRSAAFPAPTSLSPFFSWSACAFSTSHYGTKRWYEPVTGRWLSNDPIGIAGGVNQFCGFNNDGINGVDPLGFGVQRFKQGAYEFFKASGDVVHGGKHWHVLARKGGQLLGRVSTQGELLTGQVPKTAMNILAKRGAIQQAGQGASSLALKGSTGAILGVAGGAALYLLTSPSAIAADPYCVEGTTPEGLTFRTYFPPSGPSYTALVLPDGSEIQMDPQRSKTDNNPYKNGQ